MASKNFAIPTEALAHKFECLFIPGDAKVETPSLAAQDLSHEKACLSGLRLTDGEKRRQ
jgi:hypothetical protein